MPSKEVQIVDPQGVDQNLGSVEVETFDNSETSAEIGFAAGSSMAEFLAKSAGGNVTDPRHLQAAIEVWKYVRARGSATVPGYWARFDAENPDNGKSVGFEPILEGDTPQIRTWLTSAAEKAACTLGSKPGEYRIGFRYGSNVELVEQADGSKEPERVVTAISFTLNKAEKNSATRFVRASRF